jgi:DDE family transposase/transposase IS4-like protein
MAFSLRQIPDDDKLCQHVALEVFQDLYPVERICEILSDSHRWEQRERALNMVVMMYLVMALCLFPRHNQVEVLEELAEGYRYVWPHQQVSIPTAGALCYRRRQLGIIPLRQLLRRTCRPLATQSTPGAFVQGKRLMVIDGTTQDVADSPANALYFGRNTQGASRSPFPKMRCLYLAECSTHAIINAVLAPNRCNEREMMWGLLPSLEPDMLLTMDRGFFSALWVQALNNKGVHLLARLQSNMLIHKPLTCDCLPDGSWLLTISRKRVQGLSQDVRVRIIEYQVREVDLPHFGEKQRLVTTLLDPVQWSASELVALYHERWEVESSIDEYKTHLRLSHTPLRSQSPEAAYQEMYGLLLAHYAVRTLMFQSATQGRLDPDRLSFTRAVHVISRSIGQFGQAPPQEHGRLKQRLLYDLRHPLLPPRRLRFYARVVKRPLSRYRRKKPWHQGLSLKGASFSQIFLI